MPQKINKDESRQRFSLVKRDSSAIKPKGFDELMRFSLDSSIEDLKTQLSMIGDVKHVNIDKNSNKGRKNVRFEL